jgi:nitroreductase
MEFSEVLESRRAVRSYTEAPVERSTAESLIRAAVLSPSAMNTQPWEFWVVEGRRRIDGLSDRAKEWLFEKVAHNPTAAAVLQRLHLAPAEFSLLYHAPLLVLVVAKVYGKQEEEDCCIAATSLMLAARNAGLGSCWIGSSGEWFNLHSTKSELGISEGSHVVAPIVIGHPAEWPEAPGRNPPTIHWVS